MALGHMVWFVSETAMPIKISYQSKGACKDSESSAADITCAYSVGRHPGLRNNFLHSANKKAGGAKIILKTED